MSFKTRLTAAAAAAVMASGAGVALSGAANAATPSCGMNCVNVVNAQLEGGKNTFFHTPQFVLDVQGGSETTGAHIIMFRASNSDRAEDFTVSNQGTVHDFYKAGLVTASLNLHYKNNEAYELEYSPFGANSGLCVGVPSTAGNGTKVSLQACGVSSETVWVTATGPASLSQLITKGYVALINGSDTNFSHPFALNYPNSSWPTDMPRPQLQTWEIQDFSSNAIYDNELFGAHPGILP